MLGFLGCLNKEDNIMDKQDFKFEAKLKRTTLLNKTKAFARCSRRIIITH